MGRSSLDCRLGRAERSSHRPGGGRGRGAAPSSSSRRPERARTSGSRDRVRRRTVRTTRGPIGRSVPSSRAGTTRTAGGAGERSSGLDSSLQVRWSRWWWLGPWPSNCGDDGGRRAVRWNRAQNPLRPIPPQVRRGLLTACSQGSGWCSCLTLGSATRPRTPTVPWSWTTCVEFPARLNDGAIWLGLAVALVGALVLLALSQDHRVDRRATPLRPNARSPRSLPVNNGRQAIDLPPVSASRGAFDFRPSFPAGSADRTTSQACRIRPG